MSGISGSRPGRSNMIAKDSKEYQLWKEVYVLRNKYSGMSKYDDEAFNNMVEETRQLYAKYEDTDAHIPALWCCHALREMFNEEYRVQILT